MTFYNLVFFCYFELNIHVFGRKQFHPLYFVMRKPHVLWHLTVLSHLEILYCPASYIPLKGIMGVSYPKIQKHLIRWGKGPAMCKQEHFLIGLKLEKCSGLSYRSKSWFIGPIKCHSTHTELSPTRGQSTHKLSQRMNPPSSFCKLVFLRIKHEWYRKDFHTIVIIGFFIYVDYKHTLPFNIFFIKMDNIEGE